MKQAKYPRMEKYCDIEIPYCRNGRPGYKWVQGWIIRYSESRISTPVRYHEALDMLNAPEELCAIKS